MHVLVTYASKYGGTAGIAQRIAERLSARGLHADVVHVDAIDGLDGYDAVVAGGAVYLGRWHKDFRRFLDDHGAALATRPTWLFSSGPLGTEEVDEHGEDLKKVTEPAELPEAIDAIHPRAHTVFFGALTPSKLGVGPRLMRLLPAGRKLLPAGDFRDWDDIDAWADGIARTLVPGRAA